MIQMRAVNAAFPKSDAGALDRDGPLLLLLRERQQGESDDQRRR